MQMKEAGLGVRFREVMSGDFAMGETNPKSGARQGRKDDTELVLHATIDIKDIERFKSDPEHAGTLTGRVDYTPFGKDILGYNGVFNLFSPSDDPDMKLMVYELAFDHNGKSYYLAGRKEVKDDPGFDTWSDTTTLYTTLNEGADKTGSIVGAGILKLSVGQLVDMVKTFTATNATGAKDKIEALTAFGKFFLGKLWDSHAKFVSSR